MGIVRSTARDQVKKILLDRILSGYYKPGERLIELQIANELQTSQAPVREAFRYLEALRVVETETYKGTRVRAITDRELKESSQVRAALEELAGQLAAPQLKGNVQRLEEQAQKFVDAAHRKEVEEYSQHDIEFHRMILEAADNQLLLDLWESVVLESRFRLTLNRIGAHQLDEFASAHLPVIDFLRKGDGAGAGQHLKNLICKFHFMDHGSTNQDANAV